MLNFLPVPRKRWGKCLLRGGGSALLPIRNHPGSVFPLTVEPGLFLVLWPPYHFLDFCDGADRVQQIHAFQKEKEVLWYTLPGGSVVKNLPAKEGDKRDAGSTPGLGRSPGVWNGNLLQCSCLENPMDRRAWRATVYRVKKSQTWLSDSTTRRKCALAKYFRRLFP